MEEQQPQLKLKTARTLKWNAVDKFGSQILYAVIGIVLANILSQKDFGLVGALLVCQAFAILFVDSGFGTALLQKKQPTQTDYSTVFWFNLAVSVGVYVLLWIGAPLIARIFQGDERLIPLSRVMFLTFVLNGLAIVQTNVLMKRMDVRQLAIANFVGLVSSGAVGIWLALTGAGVWSLVWQYVALSAVKTGWLWAFGEWKPSLTFSFASLRSILPVGGGVFGSQMLNTASLHAYSFIIGAFYNLTSLGVYTQADKWSKMGSASLSQIMTSSFIPLLARVQDSPEAWRRYVKHINRFTAFLTLPALIGMALIGTPLFHTFFGTKWDASIVLFQILCARGVLIVLISLCNNYLTAAGRARWLMVVEVIKDSAILGAILATVWFNSLELLVWGQLGASLLTYLIVLLITSRQIGYPMGKFLGETGIFLLPTAAMSGVCLLLLSLDISPVLILLAECVGGAAAYLLSCYAMRLPELTEAIDYFCGRLKEQ